MSLIFRGLKRLTGYKETEWVAFKEDDKIAKVTEIGVETATHIIKKKCPGGDFDSLL